MLPMLAVTEQPAPKHPRVRSCQVCCRNPSMARLKDSRKGGSKWSKEVWSVPEGLRRTPDYPNYNQRCFETCGYEKSVEIQFGVASWDEGIIDSIYLRSTVVILVSIWSWKKGSPTRNRLSWWLCCYFWKARRVRRVYVKTIYNSSNWSCTG